MHIRSQIVAIFLLFSFRLLVIQLISTDYKWCESHINGSKIDCNKINAKKKKVEKTVLISNECNKLKLKRNFEHCVWHSPLLNETIIWSTIYWLVIQYLH